MYLEAPIYHLPGEFTDTSKAVFLGGSITGASDWQADAATKLVLAGLTVCNPRRNSFDLTDPTAERQQITWEHTYLSLCSLQFFYFAPETLAPITLFEYGATLESVKYAPYKKIYVAVHPEYKRKHDVYIQTELRNPQWLRNIREDVNETLNLLIKENGS